MNVLNVDTLLFVSYSDQSTTVLKVKYDNGLFTRLIETARAIYSKDQLLCPKRFHPNVKHLREELKEFAGKNVEFVCEVVSTKATNCSHNSIESSVHFHGSHIPRDLSCIAEISLEEFQCFIHKSLTCLKTAYNLCRRKATEVLAFLVVNTDRINKAEIPFTLPISYGLKGYNMNSDSMRSMIDQVLQECYDRGLYIPIVSFDGQWSNIAIRDRKGNALTRLQLQKDVYNDAKKEKKATILQRINKADVLKVQDINSLIQTVDITNTEGNITGPVTIEKYLMKTMNYFLR